MATIQQLGDTRRTMGEGNGLAVPEGFTVAQAMALSPRQFEAREKRPLQTIGADFQMVDVPEHCAIVGAVTGKVYAVNGRDYVVHGPELMAETFEAVAGQAGTRIDTIGTLKGGKLMFAQAFIPGLSFDVGTRDRPDAVHGRLSMLTSFDGSTATVIGDIATRVVCENTFAHAISESGKNKRNGQRVIGIRHTSQSEERVRDYTLEIAMLREGFADFAATADRLASRSFSAAEFLAFADALIPLPTGDASPTKAQNKRAALADLFVNGIGQDLPGARGTMWGALNAVTQWTTWHAPIRSGDQGDRWLSSVNGDGAELAQNALVMLQAVA